MAHETFDKLAGVAATARTKGDLIQEQIFVRLGERIAASGYKKFKTFADKHVAHAGDVYSRSLAEDAKRNFTLASLSSCHEAICGVAAFVGGTLLGSGYGGFPIAQFDQFENLDSPWCAESNMKALRDNWDEYADKVDSWGAIEVEDLIQKIGTNKMSRGACLGSRVAEFRV